MATNPTPEQLAQQALHPVLAEIQRQQAEERRRAQQAQTAAHQRAGGLAEVLGGIAPQTQATYQAAGDSTAAYAKGFSAAFSQNSQAAEAGLNEILAKTGTGQQQVRGAGQAGGDVLYGVGGYIPASGLAREGAAFTAAAQNLPATARFLGQQQAGQIGLSSREKLEQLNALLRQEKGKLPGLAREIRADQAEAAIKDRAQRVNEAYIESQIGNIAFDNQVSAANAETARMNAATRRQSARFNQIMARADLALDEKQFELAVLREQRLSKPKAKGGFTPKQKKDLSQQAVDTAGDDFYGVDDDPSTTRPPLETLRDLIAGGVPFSIAIRAIQRYAKGTMPAHLKGVMGVDAQGREVPMWDLWKATLGWTKKKGKR